MAAAFPPGPPPFPIARFTVEQYHRMIASGAFTEDDQLELIDGWVVQKMAKGPAHEFSLGQTEALLRERLILGWHVRNQGPITLARSEPEPDLAVARGDRGDYRSQHPRAADVALVVEISDTTVVTDRLKARTYGEAGIAEYWIVNLAARCVELHTKPSSAEESGYAVRRIAAADDSIRLVIGAHDCGALRVADLLP